MERRSGLSFKLVSFYFSFHDFIFILRLLAEIVMLFTLLHPPIKLRFSLEVAMDSLETHIHQSLQNTKTMTGRFMEISKTAEIVMDQ